MCLPRRRQRQPALGEGGGVFLVGGLELARDGHLFFSFLFFFFFFSFAGCLFGVMIVMGE